MKTVVQTVVSFVLLGIAGGGPRAEESPGGADEPGFLGVALGAVPEVLKVHLGIDGGAFVEDVAPGSPAEKAGMRRYDVILSAGGESAGSPEGLRDRIRSSKPGSTLTLGIQRGPHKLELAVTLGSALEQGAKPSTPKVGKPGFLGVAVEAVSPVLAAHLGLAEGAGAIVLDVMEGSPAAKAGIGRNDVLVALDGYDVKGPEDFRRLLGERKAGDKVSLEWIQRGSKKSVEVALESVPEGMTEPFGGPHLPEAGSARRRLPRESLPWGQRLERRGRIVLEGPDGKQHVFEFPDIPWDADDLARRIEKEVEKVKELVRPEDLQRRLKDLLKKLDADLEGRSAAKGWSRSRSHVSEVRVIEDGYDISVRSEDGKGTVTVRKDGKTIAEDLPWSRIETLPEDVRARVEKAREKVREEPLEPEAEQPAPGGPAPAEPQAPTLRAGRVPQSSLTGLISGCWATVLASGSNPFSVKTTV